MQFGLVQFYGLMAFHLILSWISMDEKYNLVIFTFHSCAWKWVYAILMLHFNGMPKCYLFVHMDFHKDNILMRVFIAINLGFNILLLF